MAVSRKRSSATTPEISSTADGRPVAVGRIEKMSKSKKNVVGLDAIVDTYGADTARLYLLSDSPPERDLEWTETGIEGIWRYVNRLWRMVSEPPVPLPPPGTPRCPALCRRTIAELRRTIHRTIAAVTDDLDKFRFNRAVARIRELTNAIEELSRRAFAAPSAPAVLREALEIVTRLLGPMMPHLAEEMWQTLGGEGLLAEQPWPVADPDLARDEQVTIAVQVNGKLRGTLEFPRDTASGAGRERGTCNCRRWRAGSTAARRARSSSCRTGSSASSPDMAGRGELFAR